MKKILLMYISEHSGHHQASIALEKAILARDTQAQVLNMNAFKYTNPVIEKITHETYMRIIKKQPHIWGYLYDNPAVAKKTKRLRSIVDTAGAKKIGRLIRKFNPGAIGCTQAFPCGLVAEYKKTNHANIPLVGILTDYAPHSYWIYDEVDVYVVPSKETGQTFMKKGVPSGKIKALGTPIDPLFETPLNKNEIRRKVGISSRQPVVLVMGGTYGIGPDEKFIKALDNCRRDFQVIVATGVNKKLFKKIKRIERSYKKKLITMGFAGNVHELMGISDIIVTKPCGMTTAE